MASLHNLIFFTIFFLPIAVSQQPYVGLTTTDCTVQHNDTSALGYFCSGAQTACRSFFTIRASPQYDTVSSIAALFGSDAAELSALNSVTDRSSFEFEQNSLVLVPVNCSCSGEFYQANATYRVKENDNYLLIANNTFQAQTTCQALQNQTGNPPAKSLAVGEAITVPLRCACPSENQIRLGFRYLLSYAFTKGESVSTVSERFGVTSDSIFEANSLPIDSVIFAYTNVLVPLRNPPTANQTLTLAPPPPPATPTATPSAPTGDGKKKKTWLYALIGAIGGAALVSAAIFVVYARRKKKTTKRKERFDEAKELALVSESFEAVEKSFAKREREEYSEEFLGRLSEIAQSIKVYRFEDLETATGGFSASSLVRNSVYRGVINGDLAAIKKVDGDISDEINLLQKINHSNVLRLSGVAFSEGFWYLVYEYASNGPLSDWIHTNNGGNPNPKSLTWTQKIQIALDVATGLDYLHSFVNPSLVHKDIKSENVLLDSDLRGKIANLGLARSTTAQTGGQDGHFSVTRHIVGTVGYMSPEYLEHGLVSTKLDVYAFGVLLLEMLAGKEVPAMCRESENRSLSDAFGGEEREEGLRGFIDISIGKNRPVELVGYVVKIVGGCLKKNPEARPSMSEIVQILSLTLSNSLTWESSKMS